jgi:hypothetical protein
LKHATEKPPLLSSFVPDIPTGFQTAVDGMMAKSPDERYSTPAEAAAALKSFLGTGGAAPAPAAMVPAFKEWLESESQLELTLKLPPAPVPSKPPAHAPVPAKPGSAPAPALASSPIKSGSAASPALPSAAPWPGPAPSPAYAKPTPAPATTPKPARPKPAAVAKPVAPPRPLDEEIDVELVTEPMPAPAFIPMPAAPQVQIVKVKDERTLTELDRRDWIMLAGGAAGVLIAVGLGYGLARLMRKKTPEEPPPSETTE